MNRVSFLNRHSWLIVLAVLALITGYYIRKYQIITYPKTKTILSYFHHVPPKFVKLMSFGYDRVVADLVWIATIQQSSFDKPPTSLDLKELYDLANITTDLSPQIELAYRYIGSILAVMGEVDLAEKILTKSYKANLKSWKMDMFLARFYSDYLNDKNKAIHHYYQAAKKKGSPLYFPGVVTKLILENYDSIDQKTARLINKEMLSISQSEEVSRKIKERIIKFNKKIKDDRDGNHH